jgi:hypothetical protein
MILKVNSLNALAWVAVAALVLASVEARALAADMKLDVQLLWGTDEAKSPNPKHKLVEPDLREKLKRIPLKWKNYFEVTRKIVGIPTGASKTVNLSEMCDLEIKNVDGTKTEVTHFGKGKRVGTRTQAMAKGEVFILGGDAPGATAWLVVLRRIE